MAKTRRGGAGVWEYLKGAFLFRWNLLFGAGAVILAALSPAPEVLLPLVAAAEATYLMGMVASPRFRTAIDAREHASRRKTPEAGPSSTATPSLDTLVAGMSPSGRRRFEELRARCLEMRSIAAGVGGRTGSGRRSASEVSSPGLDKLLWMFLRLMISQSSLENFLASTDESQIRKQLGQTKEKLAKAEEDSDERLIRSLRDSLATGELRLDNYAKAEANAEFVAVELDRLEGKIQTLSEMAINRQDPDFLSREVDSVAASMQATEVAMEELALVDGLIDGLTDQPSILEADLRGVLGNEA